LLFVIWCFLTAHGWKPTQQTLSHFGSLSLIVGPCISSDLEFTISDLIGICFLMLFVRSWLKADGLLIRAGV
jgi:hypothetical protein